MAETCQFCGQEISVSESVFVSDEQEHCHQRCLERKLVGLEFKGVKPELIEAILQSFKPQPKKKKRWLFGGKEKK